MKQFFKGLFEYSHHYNQKLGNVFIEYPQKTSEKAIKLYNHILNAQQIWNNRIEGEQTTFGIWEIHPIEDCKNIDKINHEHSILILEKFDLSHSINYATFQKQPFSNKLQDIFFHVINHSTYHRAQIATEFKQNGLDPLLTDYIFYKRQ